MIVREKTQRPVNCASMVRIDTTTIYSSYISTEMCLEVLENADADYCAIVS